MSERYGYKERMIAGFLAKFPFIKKYAKMVYQRINFRLFKKKYLFHSDYKLLMFKYEDKETFYGYYDHSPLNINNEILLFHASHLSTCKKPNPNVPVQIVVMDFKRQEVLYSLSSTAYNWQQGTRLQWLDANRFIFNDFDSEKNKYVAKIISAKSGEVEQLIDRAVYDCNNDFALSLNFDRLMLMRPDYGYFNNLSSIKMNDLNDANDGIWRINLKENTSQLLFSIDYLKKLKSRPEFVNCEHKVNHIMISPSGEKFIFLHRWFKDGVKTDRLIISDSFGKNLKILAEGMISHFSWYGTKKLFGFLAEAGEIGHYAVIDIETGDKSEPGKELMSALGDGHPNIFENKAIIDTYPNKSRMQELFVFDLQSLKLERAGEFFESFKYEGQSRCDLHPSWSMDGKHIFFDSVHSGKRQLYALQYGNE